MDSALQIESKNLLKNSGNQINLLTLDRFIVKLISDERGKKLLNLAQNTVKQTLMKNNRLPKPSSSLSSSHLGIFVSLRTNNQLRGCFGTPFPTQSLEESVQEFASMATTEDSRFSPITPEEFPGLKIEVSILSSPKPTQADQIQLGVHGLMVRKEERAALFLPQTPIQKKWSLKRFLEKICLKAELPKDAWKKEASLYTFKTQVFTQRIKSAQLSGVFSSLQDERPASQLQAK